MAKASYLARQSKSRHEELAGAKRFQNVVLSGEPDAKGGLSKPKTTLLGEAVLINRSMADL